MKVKPTKQKSYPILLRLYVAGQTPKSMLAFSNLRTFAKNIWQGGMKSKWWIC